MEKIIENANGNSLLLFFIALIITIPSILAYMKYRLNKELASKDHEFKNWIDREKTLISVIEKNAEAIIELRTFLATINKTCDTCKVEHVALWKQIRDSIELMDRQLENGFGYMKEILKPR